jgi:hypothetical protein
MPIDIGRELEELVRYHSELVRRLPQHGVQDVAELIALFERLRAALDAIGRQEIGWATEQVQRLVQALVQVDSNLQALRRLKLALGATHREQAAGPAGRGTP